MSDPAAAGAPGTPPVLGVLGAIEAEVVLVREHLVDAVEHRVGRLHLTRGFLDTDTGRRQPLVLARCGVGKVNAAMAVCALAQLGVTRAVFTGVAGAVAPGLAVGDMVVAIDLVQHDVDVTALGRPPGQLLGEPVSWAADDDLSQRLMVAARAAASDTGDGQLTVRRGRIASGDQFIASPAVANRLHQVFDADCAEMEGAAFAQACAAFGIDFAVVRTMSDTADGSAHVDFPAFLARASEVGLGVVRRLVHGLVSTGMDGEPVACSRPGGS